MENKEMKEKNNAPLVDCHAHILPKSFVKALQEGSLSGIELKELDGKKKILFDGKPHPYFPLLTDVDAQLEFMRKNRIDIQAVSIAPRLFFYEKDIEEAKTLCRMFNDDLIELAETYSDKFIAVGTLPMQDAEAACEEAEYCISRGVRAFQIGTAVCGRRLDDQCFRKVFRVIEKAGAVLMLHPVIENSDFKTADYHLSNSVGNPYQTTAAIGNMIFSGLFDEMPALKVLLVHGAGFLPYQIGRMDHAWEVRPAGEHPCRQKPGYYIKNNIYSDGLIFSGSQAELLVDVFGADHVMYGTDYPYDMADYSLMDNLEKGCHSRTDIDNIRSGNFLRIINCGGNNEYSCI